jgi:hypothetical protein
MLFRRLLAYPVRKLPATREQGTVHALCAGTSSGAQVLRVYYNRFWIGVLLIGYISRANHLPSHNGLCILLGGGTTVVVG